MLLEKMSEVDVHSTSADRDRKPNEKVSFIPIRVLKLWHLHELNIFVKLLIFSCWHNKGDAWGMFVLWTMLWNTRTQNTQLSLGIENEKDLSQPASRLMKYEIASYNCVLHFCIDTKCPTAYLCTISIYSIDTLTANMKIPINTP